MTDHWLFWTFMGYLSGSIPFGLLIGLAKGIDIRQHGSGNVGATNTGRVIGTPWGVTCFVLDLLKGAGPVLAAGCVMGSSAGQPSSFQFGRPERRLERPLKTDAGLDDARRRCAAA